MYTTTEKLRVLRGIIHDQKADLLAAAWAGQVEPCEAIRRLAVIEETADDLAHRVACNAGGRLIPCGSTLKPSNPVTLRERYRTWRAGARRRAFRRLLNGWPW